MVFAAKTPFYFLYFASGTATLSNGNTANTGDLILIEDLTKVVINALECCNVIEIEVLLP